MILHIGNYDFSEVWDGVYYKTLSNYPQVCDWELRNIQEFILYDKMNGRHTVIQADEEEIKTVIIEKLARGDYKNVSRPAKITECTACKQSGCLTRFVCHTASLENAYNILECGKLLSAVKARNLPGKVLKEEPRNAAKDPEDFFDYVMYSWGNCQAGDRLVMERKMKRPPTEEDLSIHFTPGIRFYFEYEVLDKHPGAIHDGFLPIKVKDEVILSDYVYAIIIPEEYKGRLDMVIPAELKDRIHYIVNDCDTIWKWSEKVYQYVDNRL